MLRYMICNWPPIGGYKRVYIYIQICGNDVRLVAIPHILPLKTFLKASLGMRWEFIANWLRVWMWVGGFLEDPTSQRVLFALHVAWSVFDCMVYQKRSNYIS